MRVLAAVAVVAIALTGCKFERASVASDAKTSMVGMNKEQGLACMGRPVQHASVGTTEVWSYPSGGDAYGFGTATGQAYGNTAVATGTSTSYQRYCIVNVAFSGDRVSAVNYSGRTGGLLTEGE